MYGKIERFKQEVENTRILKYSTKQLFTKIHKTPRVKKYHPNNSNISEYTKME